MSFLYARCMFLSRDENHVKHARSITRRDEQMSALSPNLFSQESCILHGFVLYFSACSSNPAVLFFVMAVEAVAEVDFVVDEGCVLDLIIPKSYAPEVELFSEE